MSQSCVYYTIRELLSDHDIGDGLKLMSANGTIAIIIGVTGMAYSVDQRAYGYMLNDDGSDKYACESKHPDCKEMKTFLLDRTHWIIWRPLVMTKHWFAIYLRKSSGKPVLSNTLYTSIAEAEESLGRVIFVRLATEYPPVILLK